MLTDEDKATLHYLRNSKNDALKREAADLIERLSNENDIAINLANELAEVINANQAS
jgi:hypothetical protein